MISGCSILAELLYIISNYMKGSIPVKKIWSKRYINLLRDSILVMNTIITTMKQSNTIRNIDIQLVLDYIIQNTGLIFQSDVSEKIYAAYETGILLQCSNDIVKQECLELMESILFKCCTLLNGKEKNWKKKLSYLLMALHNIPRALFDSDKDRYFNIRVWPLTLDDVKKSVNSYIGDK